MNFQDELTKRTDEIERESGSFSEREGFAKSMAQAMNYSMLAGGKRLRPLLMQETYRLFGGKEKGDLAFYDRDGDDHTNS